MDMTEKLADVEQRFNAARARKDALDGELKDIDAELFRLQGEFRALQGVQAPEPALTVEAKPKEADDFKKVAK